MKRYLSFFILLLSCFTVLAQRNDVRLDEVRRDAVKFNVIGSLMDIYSLQVEKSITENVSFVITGFYRRQKLIPFGSEIDQLAKSNGLGLTGVNFQFIFIDQARIGVKGVAPELRYYVGKKQNRPFVGLYGQYAYFDMSVPASLLVNYRGQDAEIITPIEFEVNTLSGGLLVGQQFRFGRFGVDLVVVGLSIGKANRVSAEVNQALLSQLNESERATLKVRVNERFGIDESYYDTKVEGSSASVTSVRKVPFLGVRGVGVNFAYYF